MQLRILSSLLLPALLSAAQVSLFDGKTLNGWEGNNEVWRVVNGEIHGGSMQGNPRNEFLATTEDYQNFHLRFEYKLTGTEGFINGGVQFRSKRIANPPNEMYGYQADIGAGYSGSLYDESRRKKFMAKADPAFIKRLEKPGEWNSYEVVASDRLILLFINGQRTCILYEQDPNIAKTGKIALQIHGNCKAVIQFRNISIENLPESAVPPQQAILSRFGNAQPTLPLPPFKDGKYEPIDNEVFVFTGQENMVREQRSASLEAQLSIQLSKHNPRFRFMAWEADTVYQQWREINFGNWKDQLQTAGATTIVAQFGQMEALDGKERLPQFIAAYHRLLDQFSAQTGRLILISPIPFETPFASHAPDLRLRNDDLKAYVEAIRDIAKQRQAVFVDLFTPLTQANRFENRLTEDGIHLANRGSEISARFITGALIPDALLMDELRKNFENLQQTIIRKNQLWFDCWRPANWSFVYGDRVNQMFGKPSGNSPSLQASFEKQLHLILEQEELIQRQARNPNLMFETKTLTLPDSSSPKALTPDEQLATFTLAEGYEANLFASEEHGVINPTQFAWDETGRLYVACSPTYPQTYASSTPADYILALEDTDHDGVADKSWKYATGLTMVQGVEPSGDGLYVCDFDKLLHLKDTDNDGVADETKILFSGFGIGDTHQLINSICHGPDGTLWFSQGLHAMSRVETPWGIARLDRSALWRLRPHQLRLEGYFGGGMAGANCWGVAFDDYGQVFHKSGDRPHGYWSVPGMVRGGDPRGSGSEKEASVSYRASPQQYHTVGPLFVTSPKTTSLDIVGTQALPEEIQGSALIGGYFGAVVELHKFHDEGSGFKTTQFPKLLKASNNAFRPVDVGVGPDGGMYLADWYNPIIGHYQASYADPRRDKSHGRIWRITHKQHKPVRQPDLARMSIEKLLEQLRSPERWTRYQAKRLLFYRNPKKVLLATDAFVAKVPKSETQLLREVIGIYQAHESPRPKLLKTLLEAKDFRIRAYATRVLGNWAEHLPNAAESLYKMVKDQHPRVRLEAVISATYLPKPEAVKIVTAALEHPTDPFLNYAIRQAADALKIHWGPKLAQKQLTLPSDQQTQYLTKLLGDSGKPPEPGAEVYQLACLACHQPEGKGLPGVYPPLANNPNLHASPDRLIKILLHGLSGPLEVNGNTFGNNPASPPMPPLTGLTNQQIADVLNYVQKNFAGKKEGAISPEQVKRVREANKARTKRWNTKKLK